MSELETARWSLKNHFRPISYMQGLALAQEFKALAGDGQLRLRAMSETPRRISEANDGLLACLEKWENQATFFETDAPETLTEAVWKKAAYIEMTLTSETLHGQAEFKGIKPKQASFYLAAPAAADAAQTMAHNHLLMSSGSGSNAGSGNCQCSLA